MKLLDFSPRPTGQQAGYAPSTDLAAFGFPERFLVWATRAVQAGLDRGTSQARLESAFAAIDAPEAFSLLQMVLGLLETEFGRPLTAPCLKWRCLMTDEARILTLIAHFQQIITGDAKPMTSLSASLQNSGQRLALALAAAGLVLEPSPHGSDMGNWSEMMPTLH